MVDTASRAKAGKLTFPYRHVRGAWKPRGVRWSRSAILSVVAPESYRISSELSVLMPSKASTMGGNQSAEELRRELAKALEQHAATAAILRVISGSPTDLRGVFAEIAAGAARLCDANDAVIRQVDGEVLRLVAHHGPLPTPATLPLSRNLLTARAVLDRRTIHLADLQAEDLQRAIAAIQGHLQQEGIALGQVYPEGSETALQLGHRTVLCVPLLHAGEAIGAILIRRTEVRPFNDREIDLLKTFADQAVIAIENARLFEAEQASKRELQESLEYQTAISDVLGVISRSPTNLQPVFDTIAQSAAQLCEAQFCHVCRFDGKLIHFGAAHGLTPEGRHALQNGYPLAPGRATAMARSILSGSVEEIPDVHTDPEYGHGGAATVMNVRSVVAVPMLKDNHPIGAIGIARSTTGRFSTRQIGLLKTFADQAVIAIENTRLFEAEQASKRELQKTLEYQKAISGVLGAISRSPSQLQPVFDVIVTSSKRLLRAYSAIVSLVVGDQLTLGAFTSLGPESDKWLKDQYPLQLGGTSNAATVVRTQKPLMVEDTETDSRVSELARRRGFRSLLMVPMMCQGRAIGTINVTRPNPGPFSQEESELLKTFADQAVIGIENTRLFDEVQARTRELTESLEQQTATADVLKVISRSALNVEKVLDALVESAARLCDAYDAAILQVFGDGLRLVAHHGQIPTTGPVGQYTLPLTRGRVFGRAVLDRRTIHVADILAEADEYPETWNTALRLGFRTVLTVPLVHAGEAIGVILIRRAEVRPFTERQIELVNTFADQAVIAIENTRLFEEVQARTKELQEALKQQAGKADVLKTISRSDFDLQTLVE